MEKKINKLKLKIKSLNIVKDVDQEKIVGGAQTGTGSLCTFSNYATGCNAAYTISGCTHREASGCPQCN